MTDKSHEEMVDEILDSLEGKRYTFVAFMDDAFTGLPPDTNLRHYHRNVYHLYKYVYEPESEIKTFNLTCRNKDVDLKVKKSNVLLTHLETADYDDSGAEISEIIKMEANLICPHCLSAIQLSPSRYGVLDSVKGYDPALRQFVWYISIDSKVNNNKWHY